MVEREIIYGELHRVQNNVTVGKRPIHPGDTIQQQYGSRTIEALVMDIDTTGALIFHPDSHIEGAKIFPGARLDKVYCPPEHPDEL